MLKFMDLAGQLLEEDMFTSNAWFENTAYFRLYGSLPQDYWQRSNSLMTFADAPRYDWYGPEYLLRRLASAYGDGHAQWLADALDEANVCGSDARFLNLLWVDPSVAPLPPDGLPTHRHFDDMDIVYMRSDWGGDESLLAFKCGPHIGHHAIQAYNYDPGGGHVHPDAGSFLLFSHGDWLVVDDGYTFKTTEYQNTALINGIGQQGEGSAWFQGSTLCVENRGAQITRADFGPDTHYLIGDVTAAYREEANLSEFLRHVLYIKPSTWVIVDEFETSDPSTFELFFHADFPFEDQGQNTYRVEGTNGSLSMQILKPADVAHQAFVQGLTGTDGSPKGNIQALRIYNSSQTQRTLFLMVLEAYPTGSAPQVGASLEDDELVLQTPAGEMRWRLDPDRSDRTDPVLVTPGGEEEDGAGGDGGGDDGGDAGVGDDAGTAQDADAGGADETSDGKIGGSCGCSHDSGGLLVLPLLVLFLARSRKFY
jgi:MYXO-CTERM domain-containing protein